MNNEDLAVGLTGEVLFCWLTYVLELSYTDITFPSGGISYA
jgi:hypothetical protein